MAKGSNNEFPSVLFAEQDHTTPVVPTPAADCHRLFVGDDGLWYSVDESDVVTQVGGGAIDSDSVAYVPTTVADWDSAADPGDVEQALDQLAERVKDLEGTVGGGEWTLVDSYTYAGDVASVAFTGLAGYTEIWVLMRNVTLSTSAWRELRVSIDNGANYLLSSGDYIRIDGNGVATNDTIIPLHSTSSASARSGSLIIMGWNLTTPKIATVHNDNVGQAIVIPTANALNALMVRASSGNITAGNIYIYAR